MWSCHEIVGLIGHRVPGVCVRSATWSTIDAFSRQLPSMFASCYLECRLAEALDQVDFLVCAFAPHNHDAAQRARDALDLQRDCFARGPTWQLADAVARRWLSPTHDWSCRAPTLWLELDHVDALPAAQLIPSLCVCTDHEYLKGRARAAPWDSIASHARFLDLVAPAVPRELESLLCADNLRALSACFQHMPPGGRIIHVSFMAAREPATIKLYCAIPRIHLMSYLQRIEWPGPFDLLGHTVQTFCNSETVDDTLYFDLTLERAILPHTAIAFSQLQLHGPNADPRRLALLALLEAEGLCERAKGAALRGWPGSDRESLPDRSCHARIKRWLDVKLTVHAGQGVGAKGYLGFAPVASMI